MPRSAGLLLVVNLIVGPALVHAEPGDQQPQTRTEAHRLWLLADAILQRHVDPPVRQQLVLGALKAAYQQNGRPIPPGLAQRVSQVESEQQLADVLKQAGVGEKKQAQRAGDWDALAGALLASVPGRAGLLTAADLEAEGIHTGNRYVGTGIQIRKDQKEGYIQIVLPIAGGPARRAGAKPGDLVLSIDGVNMKGHSLQDMVQRVRGQEGKPVTFVVRQPGSKQTRTLHMIRGVVPFENVVGYRRTGEESWQYRIAPTSPIVYLQLNDLTASTARQLRDVEGRLSEDTRAVVLDLRQVLGTQLQYAEQVADALIDSGVLWHVRDATGQVHEHRADRDCLFRGLPMVVLIDGTTRGKTALVAAALRSCRHAIIVGQPAQIDPWVHERITLPEGLGALRLATGLVEQVPMPRTPRPLPPGQGVLPQMLFDGSQVANRVQPDQYVEMNSKQVQLLAQWNLQQHSPEPPADALRQRPEDPPLARAVSLLKEQLNHANKHSQDAKR